MLVILAIQEAEIGRIMVQSQPRQTVHKTLSQKKTSSFCLEGGGEITYRHISKCKNDKIKKKTHHKKKDWWSGSRYRSQHQKKNFTKEDIDFK
jgi:hypothetical protein